jgi:hypothetical protein
MIWQRLNPDHTMDAVVQDLHRGGADRLSGPGKQPLSQRVRSYATAAYCKARQRLPLKLFQNAFWYLARFLAAKGRRYQDRLSNACRLGGRFVQLLDGTTFNLPGLGNIPKQFPPAKNQHGEACWCICRAVAGFCLATGAVLSFCTGGLHTSEQVLAWDLFSQADPGTIFVGDRNFGVFSVVERAVHNHLDVIFRLTADRAKALLKHQRRPSSGQEAFVKWSPSKGDKLHPQAIPTALPGRVIFVLLRRDGFRDIPLWLFTTLPYFPAYSVKKIVACYGYRWHAELNFRYLKSEMDMDLFNVKSAEMGLKELWTGLMAYNLVRVVMLDAALKSAISPLRLSFSSCRRFCFELLGAFFFQAKSSLILDFVSDWLNKLDCLARFRLPNRNKPRPPEPRRNRHKRETFPSLVGSRAAARAKLLAS